MTSSRSVQTPALCWLVAAPFFAGACGPTPPSANTPDLRPVTKPTASAAPTFGAPSRQPNQSPSGDTVSIVNGSLKITNSAGEVRSLDNAALHAVPGFRGLLDIHPQAATYLESGTLLVGMGDGTVTALNPDGMVLYSVGFRGAIAGFIQTKEGSVALSTTYGVVALLSGDGKVRWERHVTAEKMSVPVSLQDGTLLVGSQRGIFAFNQGGELLFSHTSALLHKVCDSYGRDCDTGEPPKISVKNDEVTTEEGFQFRLKDAHPPVPSLTPVFPLTFRKVLSQTVLSIVKTGPTQVAALATTRKPRTEYEWDTDDQYDVVQIDGTNLTRASVPQVASKKEEFVKDGGNTRAPIFVDRLVMGPNNNLWVLARKLSPSLTSTGDAMLGRWGGAGQIFEQVGTQIKERGDLFKEFFGHWLSIGIAAPAGEKTNFFCYGYDSPNCAAYDGTTFRTIPARGQVASVTRVGEAYWALTVDGLVHRIDAKKTTQFEPVTTPDKTPFTEITGVSEKDAWATYKKRYTVLHFDGTTWNEVAIPLVDQGFVARASDDVWNGKNHWDGKTWSIVHGGPPNSTILANSKENVWIGNNLGLWHGTAPGPAAITLPTAKDLDDSALTPSIPAPLGADENQYTVEKVNIEVAGSSPLKTAKNVASSPDGVLWFVDWHRVVELDAKGKATIVRTRGREEVTRWAYPSSKGRGIVLERDDSRGPDRRDEVRAIDGSKVTSEEIQLDRQDTVAVHGDPKGATWVVGAPSVFRPGKTSWYQPLAEKEAGKTAWNEFSPHALVRETTSTRFRPVLGLPSAAWVDVAATSDGGAFFVGGLTNGPSGQGILVQAKGALGAGGLVRVRAAATLLAVGSVSPDEAWAVGAGGTIVHLKGATVTRFTLRSGEWLRAVTVVQADNIWIAGEGGTLIHYDGTTFHPVVSPLRSQAAFTGITSLAGQIWAVSPSGIVRLTKKP